MEREIERFTKKRIHEESSANEDSSSIRDLNYSVVNIDSIMTKKKQTKKIMKTQEKVPNSSHRI